MRALRPCSRRTNCEVSRLVNTQVTDEGIKVIGPAHQHPDLDFGQPWDNGSGMAHLDGIEAPGNPDSHGFLGRRRGDAKNRQHASLRRLYLSGWETRKGLAELVRLTSLDELAPGRNLKDDDLLPIGKMTNLPSLNAGLLHVTDEGLRRLKDMKRLPSLDLRLCNVTDDGMAYVAQNDRPRRLHLNKRIGDAGVAQLTGLTNLKELDLARGKITDAGLAKLTARQSPPP